MRHFLSFLAVAVFAIFVGSQITEGVLLVPYWQSLDADSFSVYYRQFGPSIAQFYTVLTIVAALIPVAVAIDCRRKHAKAFRFAVVSSFLAALFIACFYVYFKGANDLFYQATLSEADLQKELVTWSTWHWGRIVIEVLSMIYLMLALSQVSSSLNGRSK